MKKIVITNGWSHYNKGDAAIVMGTINYLNDTFKNVSIEILAFNDVSFRDHTKEYGDNVTFLPMPSLVPPLSTFNILFNAICYFLPRLSDIVGFIFIKTQLQSYKVTRKFTRKLDDVLKSIEDADLVVSVGGNYLYSHLGLYNHLIPIIYAHKKKIPIILFGQTMGPFRNNFMKRHLLNIFNNVEHIFFREELSQRYMVEEFGLLDDKTSFSGDMAFLLDNNVPYPLSLKNEKLKIGISIRKYRYKNGEQFRDYISCMYKISSYLLSKGHEIYIIPFSYEIKKENDLHISYDMYNKLKLIDESKVFVLNLKEDTPVQILGTLKELNLDIFIATRLHSAIYASILGIPSVIISYQHFKAYGISEQLGLSKYVIKMEEITYDDLFDMVIDLSDNRHIISSHIINSVQNIRKNISSTKSIINSILKNNNNTQKKDVF